MSSTALVTVVSGDAYHDFADRMFETAREHFHPTEDVTFVKLPGREGWPAATMYRHKILRDGLPPANFVFLIDADMVFTGPVGPEIIPPRGLGITATLHPGFVGKSPFELPFERRLESVCCVLPEFGGLYYCGGFFGGERLAMRLLLTSTASMIDADAGNGITPMWHDESALNRHLLSFSPDVVLDPRYCCPDRADWYQTFWPIDYRADARIVALDKTAETRGDRAA